MDDICKKNTDMIKNLFRFHTKNVNKSIQSVTLTIKRIWTLIRLFWGLNPLLATIWAFFLLVGSIFPALQIWLQKSTVNSIAGIGLNEKLYYGSLVLLGVLYLSNIMYPLIDQLTHYFYAVISETVNCVLKKKILNKAVHIPLEYYEQDEFYNQLSMADASISRKSIEVVSYLFIILQQFMTLIGIFGMLTAVHWILPIALLISSLPGIILLFSAKTSQFKMMVNTTSTAREMAYTNSIIIKREFAKEIRVFQLGQYLIERWGELYDKYKCLRLKQVAKETRSMLIGVVILQITALIVAILLVSQIKAGKLTIGDYVALISAVTIVQGICGVIGMNIGNIFEVSLYNKALFDFLEIKEYTTTLTQLYNTDFNKIRIRDISFRYPDCANIILEHISFEINRGDKIAIIGENGAGKTTLVNCIMGLFKVTEGSIYIEDTNILDIKEDSLSQNITAVFQDFSQYSYSIRENVCFGDISKLNNDEEILNILDDVGLRQKIQNLPLGLDTPLGKEFSDGQELSGGEWQRIAIARALISDAKIVILDEPTAALDPMAELDIFNCFQKLAKNKTTIMISHRLGPVRYADRILVLNKGRLVEQGTHDELIKKNGEYAKMYLAQSKWYQDDDANKLENIC